MARRRTKSSKPAPEAMRPPTLPNWHGLLTPVVAHTFDELRVSVALWIAGDYWYPIHIVPNVNDFEYEHGVASRRWAYNFRSFEEARRERKIIRGELSGFRDLFVPVQDSAGVVRGILVAGPFSTSTPTSAQILQRWNDLSGSHGRLADPSFAQYVAMTLSTLTLEGPLASTFERLMSCFERLVSARGDSQELAAEAEILRLKLLEARASESMWDAARSMVDERTTRTWPQHAHMTLARLGMKRVPEHVVVGLLRGRQDEPDLIDDLLRRDSFQRACVVLARKQGNAVCGQVGDHGVVFLVDCSESPRHARARTSELASRAAAVARRMGLKLHAGVSQATASADLPARYRAALWAAEKALTQGTSIVYGEPGPEVSAEHLRDLRSELGRGIAERVDLLSPRFDRYLEAVLAHSGYRLERTRAHLEAGLERMAEPLLAGGFLDPKGWRDLAAAIERASDDARTVMDLAASYRRLIADIEAAIKSPTAGRQERGTRRAIAFIRQHLSEPLNLAQAARAAGFAPHYFSKLFLRDEGVTFSRYLRDLRLARAQQMLAGTKLRVEQVQRLSGFPTRTHFHRAFKKATGMTPSEYREQG